MSWDTDSPICGGVGSGSLEVPEPWLVSFNGVRRSVASVADLQGEILRVFRDVPRPPNEELLHAECRDVTPVLPFEAWRMWQGIPTEVLCRNYDAMSFFSPRAFRFFLPAFLRATLRLFMTSDEYVSDATVYELNPHSEYARSRFVLFTEEERGVVAAFLQHMIDNPEHADSATARAALSGFWARTADDAR